MTELIRQADTLKKRKSRTRQHMDGAKYRNAAALAMSALSVLQPVLYAQR